VQHEDRSAAKPLLTGNVKPENNPKLRGEDVVAMDADDTRWNAPSAAATPPCGGGHAVEVSYHCGSCEQAKRDQAAATQLGRYYSEREHPLGPPTDSGYGVGPNGEPIQLPRDTRVWVSGEWAEEHGFTVPENWRELT
jgi:hypothetical protein